MIFEIIDGTIDWVGKIFAPNKNAGITDPGFVTGEISIWSPSFISIALRANRIAEDPELTASQYPPP